MSVLVIMGVCGSGKSSVGRSLSQKFGCPFVDGDEVHPASNVEKMSRGIPLTNEDRRPWLEQLHSILLGWCEGGEGVRGVLACSALKRRYRDILVNRSAEIGDISSQTVFVLLHGSVELLRERLTNRTDHFMPPALLQSQLDDLELPQLDERVLTPDISLSINDITEYIVQHLNQ